MLVHGECECFVMQMLYVCVLCASKRHSLQAVDLSQRSQTAVQIVLNLPAPSNGGPISIHFVARSIILVSTRKKNATNHNYGTFQSQCSY